MQLIHFGLELQMVEKDRSRSPSETVYRAITGKSPSRAERPHEPGVHVKVRSEKLDIRWHPERIHIQIEYVPSPNHCTDRALALLSQINSVAPISTINNTEMTTYWILPTPNYDFTSLERKYRETMTSSHEDLAYGIVDSSVLFDAAIDDCLLYHQSGAMDSRQLINRYLIFKPDEVPATFLFLRASITNKNVIKYSQSDIRNLLMTLFSHCKIHSEKFKEIWRGLL